MHIVDRLVRGDLHVRRVRSIGDRDFRVEMGLECRLHLSRTYLPEGLSRVEMIRVIPGQMCVCKGRVE